MEHNPVNILVERANSCGVSMSKICKRAGVAESTPSRWRGGNNGPSFIVVTKLNRALDEIIADSQTGVVE
jgi:transcriptional regulator with XRE-family HTH domain